MRKFNEFTQKKIIAFKVKAAKVVEAAINKLSENNGNFLEEALKYIIGLVIGALFMGGIYLLFKNVIIPSVGTKVQDFFNFSA
ncbi:DUF6133 family protein [Anaerocolumna chitinilytica]|uniref:Uncharacterized protein n=1 Tax=Anaerocolumna chitinilytica TaxID=1727145 RepID=A0A7I8DIW4_9FIRM|nr:DUF6133 family protein [Anaerocolumna chitinilytica]BCJ98393.1 hypothetical protein bsdcttw_14340 [Anaerocolumna chitinilytica]